MKKIISILFIIISVTAVAQPQLIFRFANPEFTNGKFKFDVELRADLPGTFHRDLQVYINYNPLAFGNNVVASETASITSLDLLTPKYQVVNFTDNTESKIAIITEALFEFTDPGYSGNFLELPTQFTGICRVSLDVVDQTKVAGISFDQPLMNGGQYAQQYYAAQPVAYYSPNIYFNNWNNLSIPGQNLVLEQGWSGISGYLEPELNNVEQLFAPVEGDLILINDLTNIYYPAQNINTLITWQNTSGYVLKMNNANELKMAGFLTDSKDLSISQGWSLIPVLSECDVDVADLFNTFPATFVKEVAGWKVYWPEYGINTLVSLEPGKAYFTNLADETSITFPECTTLKSSKLSDSGEPSGTGTANFLASTDLQEFNIIRTASTHTIALPASAIEIGLDCIILAIDENGNRCGLASWNGESTSITLFGDDPLTEEKDGFYENDHISFRALNRETEEETDIFADWNPSLAQHDGLFVTNGLSAVSGLKLAPTTVAENGDGQVLIYPNPTSGKVNIQLSKAGAATISVFNTAGQLILNEQFSGSRTAINMADFEPGIYFIEVKGDKLLKTDRLIKN